MAPIKLSTLFLLVLFFTACGGSTYYLETTDARGIEAGDDVYRQGIVVGEVEEVGFEGNRVMIEISVQEPLYEGQGFSIRGEHATARLELDAPHSDANELAEGATLRHDGLEVVLEGLGSIGNSIGDAIENVFSGGGRSLETRLEQLGERLERWGASMEDWGQNNEHRFEELERKLNAWAEDHEAEMEALDRDITAWSKNFEGDLEDFASIMEQVSEAHPVGSEAWKQALKEALEQ
ncbi:MlaD family protein [Neolewinella lacunae]|uniref:MCE family protein n=1 Tax=Neolewinella lacunae TaxID=1517758 RepID=A0A923T986_9BACT|nr:MlaD family protein [Neolewinella lacunae]MBC6996460.1 MCE family protein [Neolewinella lacunae]MDN3633597.1 MlaD family protein [Neolewinella lacunae]